MIMRKRSTFGGLSIALLLFSTASPAWAQRATYGTASPSRTVSKGDVDGGDDGGDDGETLLELLGEAGVTSDAAVETAVDPLKQKRLAKINAIQFDRRPSTILRVWSEEAQEKVEAAQLKEEEAAKPDEAKPDEAKPDEAKPEEAKPDEPAAEPKSPEEEAAEAAAKLEAEEAAAAAKLEAEALANFDKELKLFQNHVTLSRWGAVKDYVASLDEEEGKALYQQMLTSLSRTASSIPANASPEVQAQLAQLAAMQNQQRGRVPEKNVYSFEDILALIAAAPTKLEDTWLATLGQLVRLAFDSGNIISALVFRLEAEVAKPEDQMLVTRRQAAQLLLAAGQTIEIGKFLPTVGEAAQASDFEGLNLLTTHLLAKYAIEKEVSYLEGAWGATQAVLAGKKIEKAEKKKALSRAVELAPKIRESLGNQWLEESFTGQPERGMEIIATIGGSAATGLQNRASDPTFRLKGLELQATAVEALLKASPELAEQWQPILRLLALNWLQEAKVAKQYDTSTSRRASMRRDAYGNLYYYNGPMMQQAGRIQAIPLGKLLDMRPSDVWLDMVSDSARPEFDKLTAQLLLKVGEDDEAFPYVETLAASHPKIAKELVDEFLTVWTTNHDPNASRNRTNVYMYMYGFERKAEGIPLTRSKQERNLKELAALVKRLNKLPVELDETLLARAFTTCHSSAEVYRVAAIEEVFGSVESLEPKTLAELAQRMRSNLMGVWRNPANQEKNGTRRKKKDIEAEVMRGYEVARDVVEKAIEKHPDDWALHLALASLNHDENNYQRDIQPSSGFSGKRLASFDGFVKAAELYVSTLDDLSQDDETTKPFEIWYYAALGACDLNQVKPDMVPSQKQASLIRDALAGIPGDAAERHLDMFANTLFTRMSSVNPGVKPQYLKMGFAICGDRDQASEAKKVFDYYADLVSEIRLKVHVDGADVVGTEPFGLFVDIEHTREIERESGGFRRYLQNQNSGRSTSYNYGRPTEDYLEKFEETARQALDEHFEVMSVTFQDEDVNSRSLAEYGWRYTPYAYILVKARGPEVDGIPPLRLNLDFLDTSGYVVLPVESPVVPIDAAKPATTRPIDNLSVTQTLDERQAKDGKLIVEIKASGHGLVPSFDDLLDVDVKGFEVTGVEDEGVSVSRFDPESDDNLIVSERIIMVTLEAEDGDEVPTNFAFGEAKLPVKEVVYQRYSDADLVAVDRLVDLEETYGEAKSKWIVPVIAVSTLAVVALIGGIVFLAMRKPSQVIDRGLQLPDQLTPFTVLGLLRSIEQNNGFGQDMHQELQGSIAQIEHFYFGETAENEPDLRDIAQTWVSRAR